MRKFLHLFLCAVLAVSFTACNDDEEVERPIYDFPGYELGLYVEDAEGKNLLDPAVSNNIVNEPVKVTYKGKTYEKDAETESKTRYLPAKMYGLVSATDTDGCLFLSFGDLPGADPFVDEPVIIEWGDGTKDTILVNNKIVWNGNEPSAQRSFILNGKAYEAKITVDASRKHLVYKFVFVKG